MKVSSALKMYLVITCVLCYVPGVRAQFPAAWEGVWKGTMHLYGNGVLNDSVPVTLTIRPLSGEEWTWKTEYQAAKGPVVKDYKLRVGDAARGQYLIDEGEGLVLSAYWFAGRLYSLFEVSGQVLTAIYAWEDGRLSFEVSSGRREGDPVQGVGNYRVTSLQRVVYSRQ